MSETRANPKLERALEQLFPAPDEAFLANLETQFLAEARNRMPRAPVSSRNSPSSSRPGAGRPPCWPFYWR